MEIEVCMFRSMLRLSLSQQSVDERLLTGGYFRGKKNWKKKVYFFWAEARDSSQKPRSLVGWLPKQMMRPINRRDSLLKESIWKGNWDIGNLQLKKFSLFR